ncbi:hypothetical protein HAX54_036450 [Datura stramonium]|uniref:Uncharacterized protein n=1 Tax=Datura stramonium TaxID=4076 RepID=A0ABS8VJM3_DATST|nr:hypothetical protein [Datura stramonium]
MEELSIMSLQFGTDVKKIRGIRGLQQLSHQVTDGVIQGALSSTRNPNSRVVIWARDPWEKNATLILG